MKFILTIFCSLIALSSANAQFIPDEEELMIMVSDGTNEGKHSTPIIPQEKSLPAGSESNAEANSENELLLDAPIRSLGMTDCIQAAAFLERPTHGIVGFMLIFSINDSIGGKQGSLMMPDGRTYEGVYRLIRQKMSETEEIPEGMTTYKVEGTFFLLGMS